MAAWSAKEVKRERSSLLNPPFFCLLIASRTPIVFSLTLTGTQMIFRVLNSVLSSTPLKKRLSFLGEFTISGFPCLATHPAIPSQGWGNRLNILFLVTQNNLKMELTFSSSTREGNPPLLSSIVWLLPFPFSESLYNLMWSWGFDLNEESKASRSPYPRIRVNLYPAMDWDPFSWSAFFSSH